MPRLTLSQCAQSRRTEVLGVCQNDLPSISQAVNSSQERLIYAKEAGDEGWHGTWAEIVFNVLQSDPYITLSRYGARISDAMVCNQPVKVNNQFYEYLLFGNGRQPRFNCTTGQRVTGRCGVSPQAYARGVFPTFRDFTPGHILRIRAENQALDTAGDKRVLVQGTDTTDTVITSQDVDASFTNQVQGLYLRITAPFVDMPFPMNSITGLQKDPTNGPIQFWDVDPNTGNETIILTMDPGEVVSGYTRYFFDRLPLDCCPVINDSAGNPTVQIRAMVKLNLIPVVYGPDYLLIQSLEAIIAEAQSARYSTMDDPRSKAMALGAHRDAIRLLMGEMAHYYGIQSPAIGFMPFGSARLERQGIGLLM